MTQVATRLAGDLAWPPDTDAGRVATRSCCTTLHHYRVGPVSVSARSDVPSVLKALHAYYAPYETNGHVLADFHVDVLAGRSVRSLKRYYHILGNGEELFVVRREASVLPHVEWAINMMVANYLPNYLQIHASVMSRGGAGAVFAGTPGQGKTTIAAGLLARGWSYLSDEFALIEPETHLLHAYPKALCIKAGSFDVVRRMGLPLSGGQAYLKGDKGPVRFVNPLAVRSGAVSDACPLRMVFFPHYCASEPPRVEPISRAQAVFELIQVSFNFPKLRRFGFELLSDVVEQARCYRLRTGDLGATCDLVDRCYREMAAGGI